MSPAEILRTYNWAILAFSLVIPMIVYGYLRRPALGQSSPKHSLSATIISSVVLTYIFLVFFGLIPEFYLDARMRGFDANNDGFWNEPAFNENHEIVELVVHDSSRSLLPFTAIPAAIFITAVSLALLKVGQAFIRTPGSQPHA